MVYLRACPYYLMKALLWRNVDSRVPEFRLACYGTFGGYIPGGWSVIRPDRILIEFLLKFYRISVRFCGLGRGKFAGVRFNC